VHLEGKEQSDLQLRYGPYRPVDKLDHGGSKVLEGRGGRAFASLTRLVFVHLVG
jgi:hypothetical protein